MLTIKRQRKIKTLKHIKDKENWALVEHEGNKRIPRGIYRICPCCFYPEKLGDQELKALLKVLQENKKKIILPYTNGEDKDPVEE